MRKIIKDRVIVDDIWTVVTPSENGLELPTEGNVIVDLATWQANKEALLANSNLALGLALEGYDGPAEFAEDLSKFQIVTINFPAFKDGRGYSLARIIRERHNFTGELRAIGDVLRDQLFFLYRCGFNAFRIREDRSIEDALNAYNDFTITYQGATDNPDPIYRR